MTNKDQHEIAKLYLENSDEHSYQDTWHEDLINSKEYKSVAIIVNGLRDMDDRLIWNSILSINTGDKNNIVAALDELDVNPRFRANIGGSFDNGEGGGVNEDI